jgi:predicted ABC-type sugar transport system permease subunit
MRFASVKAITLSQEWEKQVMQRGFLIGLGCGLIPGLLLAFAEFSPIASAQGPAGTTGLYQIQTATGLAQPGNSAIWRLNTATGALDFCTFTNLIVAGANHVTCQGNATPK